MGNFVLLQRHCPTKPELGISPINFLKPGNLRDELDRGSPVCEREKRKRPVGFLAGGEGWRMEREAEAGEDEEPARAVQGQQLGYLVILSHPE